MLFLFTVLCKIHVDDGLVWHAYACGLGLKVIDTFAVDLMARYEEGSGGRCITKLVLLPYVRSCSFQFKDSSK